jgi:hypothetical protein
MDPKPAGKEGSTIIMAFVRTPIYSTLERPRAPEAPRAGVDAVETTQQPAREQERDGYFAKLIKYVPGEIVAVFASVIALAAAVSDDPDTKDTITIAVYGLFLIATPIYFWMRSSALTKSDRPAWYFYLLSAFAFAIWALAVSDRVRDTVDLSAAWSEFFLGLGAFIIPFLDEFLTRLFPQ